MVPHLDSVMLVCVDCVNAVGAVQAIEYSKRECGFADTLLLTSLDIDRPYVRNIPPVTSVRAYSSFIVNELHKHIQTSHCLIVQHDGWLCNPYAWRNEWLAYDYVGGNTHWTGAGPDGVGGNGGFSLRSRKLLAMGGDFINKTFGCHPEDVYFSSSRHGRKTSRRAMFEEAGCRFAPRSEQQTFCNERMLWAGEFGHHKCDLSAWKH